MKEQENNLGVSYQASDFSMVINDENISDTEKKESPRSNMKLSGG